MSQHTIHEIVSVLTMELACTIREMQSYISLVDAATFLQQQAEKFEIKLQEAADLLFQHGWNELQKGKKK